MHLAKHGIAIESRVHWGKNDESLYFRDPDGHALELISGDHWQANLPFADDFKGHPSLNNLLEQQYQILTF